MNTTKFVFDKTTGTYQQKKADEPKKPLPVSSPQPQKQTEKNEDGETIYKFRAVNDLTSFQVVDEQTRKPMMVISGYALSMRFNMAELRSSVKVEQLLQGLSDMFRKMIIEQSLNEGKG